MPGAGSATVVGGRWWGWSGAAVGAPLMGETIPRCHCTLPLTVPPAHIRIWDTDRVTRTPAPR
jgi:hypothetical protein